MNSERSQLIAGKTMRRSDESAQSDRSDQQLPGKMSLGGKEAQNEGRRVRTLERPRYISRGRGLVSSVNPVCLADEEPKASGETASKPRTPQQHACYSRRRGLSHADRAVNYIIKIKKDKPIVHARHLDHPTSPYRAW